MFNFLGGPFSGAISGADWGTGLDWLKPIATFLDNLIIPITIIIAIAGGIWSIWLGVKLARAEEESKAKEAKKALINVIVAIVVTIIVLWLLVWFVTNMPTIFNQKPIDNVSGTSVTSATTSSKFITSLLGF